MGASDVRARWRELALSTERADRARAESAVKDLYGAAGFEPPSQFIWYDSPFAAAWAVALLLAPRHPLWRDRLQRGARSREERESSETARAGVQQRLGAASWDEALRSAGHSIGTSLQYPPAAPKLLSMEILSARMGLSDDVSALFVVHGDEDDLARVEDRLWGGNRGALISELHCPVVGPLVGSSAYADYSFSMMADDEARIGDQSIPVLGAAWEVARSAGLWWPFSGAAILSERPSELHVNERGLLQRGDGAAAVYRDGRKVYAWNGIAVPGQWILHPEEIPARELKHFDVTFREYVSRRVPKASKKSGGRRKPSEVLKTGLPEDVEARIARLRELAGGMLPRLDRYLAGQHREVWAELIALGGEVRFDPNAADALAVACETMRRVDQNVRTLVERLGAMQYEFATAASRSQGWIDRAEDMMRVQLGDVPQSPGTPNLRGLLDMVTRARGLLGDQLERVREQPRDATIRAHVPPDAKTRKAVENVERDVGSLPLSLRAFYEIVGRVDLTGRHPVLAPAEGSIAPDPLMVYGIDEALDEDDEEPAIIIAPDDLHKADTSGGDPYMMAVPDQRADGELLNERHRLFFVDYLRLAFRYGGFSGYEGFDDVMPREIESLRSGLIDF